MLLDNILNPGFGTKVSPNPSLKVQVLGFASEVRISSFRLRISSFVVEDFGFYINRPAAPRRAVP